MGHAVCNEHHTQLEWDSVHNVHHTQLEWGTQYIKNITNMNGAQHIMDITKKKRGDHTECTSQTTRTGHPVYKEHHKAHEWGSAHNGHHTKLEWGTPHIIYTTNN